jgi:hypothetical protein
MSKKPILLVDFYELAWAAGFFDGEGSVYYRGRKRQELCLAVSQSDRRPLDRFCSAVGIGAVRGPYKAKYSNAKPYYVYSIGSHVPVQAVVAMLWRWLSEPKREQATQALRAALPRLIRGSKGRAALSMAQADVLRAEHASAKTGRQRVPQGWIAAAAERYQIKRDTIASIVQGYGYNGNKNRKEASKWESPFCS